MKNLLYNKVLIYFFHRQSKFVRNDITYIIIHKNLSPQKLYVLIYIKIMYINKYIPVIIKLNIFQYTGVDLRKRVLCE